MKHEMSLFKDNFESFESISNRKYNKQFHQNYNEKNIKTSFDQNNRFFYKSNNVYQISRQKRSKQNDRSFRMKIIIKIEKTNDREFNRNNRNKYFDKKNYYKNKKSISKT